MEEAEKLYKTGIDDLKTSVFRLKFNADYVSAVGNFERSGKIFSDLGANDKAINSYFKAIECNKKLIESWGEGTNLLRIAEIYFFKKQDFKNGLKYLEESQISFKLAGKYHTSLKVFTDLSLKLQETAQNTNMQEYNDIALIVLRNAWEDLIQHLENDMMRINLDGLYSKLIDNYLSLDEKSVNLAIQLTNEYIGIMNKIKETKKHKLINAFAKLLMLKLINKEINICDEIVEKARSSADGSTLEDIRDMELLLKAFKNKNSKDYNYQITYCYHLFERNLIKKLKISFDAYCNYGTKSEDFLGESEYDKKENEAKKEKEENEKVNENPDDFL